jgi:hypothetical protein
LGASVVEGLVDVTPPMDVHVSPLRVVRSLYA